MPSLIFNSLEISWKFIFPICNFNGTAMNSLNKNKVKQFLKAYNLFYLFMCLIWPPFHLYIIKTDKAGRTIMILSILAITLNLFEFWKNKKLFVKPAFICWSILLCYSIWNVFAKGFNTEFTTLKFLRVNYFDSFVFLIIMLLELNRNKEKALRILWIALGVYLLIGIPSFRLGDEGRYSIQGIGNGYPLHVVCFLFVSSVLFAEKKINKTFLLVLVAVTSVVILLSGSRKAFGGETIILLGIVLNNGKKKNVWTWIRIVVFGVLLVYGVKYVMDNTLVGERILASKTDDVFYVKLVENQKINDFLMLLLGDRAIMYEMGIELFHEHFWTGIGLTNFMDVTRYEQRIHSEYIVQLCENGFIGFVLLMLYYVLLIIGLVRNRTEDNKNKKGVVLFGLIALLFLNLTCWTYCQNFAMVFYAIVLMYAYFDSKTDKIEVNIDENCDSSPQRQLQ